MTPRAVALYETGELARRAKDAERQLDLCSLCPRRCGARRTAGRLGVCGIGPLARVASFGPHFGEEPPLVGPVGSRRGSGTIFFSGCNLLCSFCQNYDISHSPAGPEVTSSQLAAIMMDLSDRGCHNINLVTPSHVIPQILSALLIAVERGLRLPVVYNSSGYDSVESLRMLDGVVDIYMPDLKFWTGEGSAYLPGVQDYAEVATAAIHEMHRQVGDLKIENAIAVSGVLVRHLVMPGGAADTRSILRFLASLSPDTYVNIMDQYRPNHRVYGDPVIGSRISSDDYRQALSWAREAGLHFGFR